MVQPGRTVSIVHGRGTGKTYLARALVHSLAMGAPHQQIGLLYPSLKQARAVIWEGPTGLFADYAMLMREGQMRRYHRGELTAEYSNGSRLSTWGAENAHAILGQRFSTLIEDEADDIRPELERTVIQPTFSRSGLNARWVKFGTPRRGKNGTLYADFTRAEQQEKGYRTDAEGNLIYAPHLPRTHWGSRVRSDESPQVDQAWLARVRSDLYAAGKGSVYEREYCCNFSSQDGLVYSTFDEGFHVAEPHPDTQWGEIIGGIDHGWMDPAVLLVGKTFGKGADAGVHVVDEVYQTQQPDSWWIERAWELEHRHRRDPSDRICWYADPSRPDRIALFRKAGLHVVEAKNAIEDGVSAVQDRLTIFTSGRVEDGDFREWARFYVSARCTNTIAEFGLYRRKRDVHDKETVLDAIEGKNDHAMDCVKYMVLSHFGGESRARRTSGAGDYS
jgi:hypothetical protein